MQIAAAYEVLADDEKRKLYDQVSTCIGLEGHNETTVFTEAVEFDVLPQFGEEGLRTDGGPGGPGGGFPGGGTRFQFQVACLTHTTKAC